MIGRLKMTIWRAWFLVDGSCKAWPARERRSSYDVDALERC